MTIIKIIYYNHQGIILNYDKKNFTDDFDNKRFYIVFYPIIGTKIIL